MREERPESRAMFPETIPWYLIQGIAIVQLYLEERFVEPPRTGRMPFSLLYHQTMSTLASEGELTPRDLASRVLSLSPFGNISQDDYKVLLRHLLATDQIERTETGGLIVGLSGERVVNSYKFYAVFQENVEYSVRCGSEVLGTIVRPPQTGRKIAIAGRVWVVEEVDHKKKEVFCSLVKGNIPAYFGDVAGDIHTRILERMKGVLSESKEYPYLLNNARARLFEARETFLASGLQTRPLVNLGGRTWAFFPWLGSYAFLAMERFLKRRCGERLGLSGFDSRRPYYMQFSMTSGEDEFFKVLREEAEVDFDPETLLGETENPVFEKYDEFLPPELLRRGFARGVLDIEGMKRRVVEMCDLRESGGTSVFPGL